MAFVNYGLIKRYLETFSTNITSKATGAMVLFNNGDLEDGRFRETAMGLLRAMPDAQEHMEIIANMMKPFQPGDYVSMKYYTENLRWFDRKQQGSTFALPHFKDLNEQMIPDIDRTMEKHFMDAVKLLTLTHPEIVKKAFEPVEKGTYVEMLVYVMGEFKPAGMKFVSPCDGNRFSMMLAIAKMVCELQGAGQATPIVEESKMLIAEDEDGEDGIADPTNPKKMKRFLPLGIVEETQTK